MNKSRYLLRRLALALVVPLGVLVITFTLARIVPGDPVLLYAGPRTLAEEREAIRSQLGLDRPLPAQFIDYAGDILRGDLGISLRTRRPITDDLRLYLPATLELVILSLLLSLAVGIPVGVLSAARPGRALDQAGQLFSIAGVSVPAFWLALLLQLLFFSILGWLPLGGRVSRGIAIFMPIERITGFYLIDAAVTGNWAGWLDALWHLLLPVVVLAAYPLGLVIRMVRAAMVEALAQPYITTARAAGLPERLILFRLALKNALIPTLVVLGLSFAFALTGSVLVEKVFSWPGLGSYVTDAILASDFQVVIAVTLLMTFIYIGVNLVVDLLQAMLDPRIKLS